MRTMEDRIWDLISGTYTPNLDDICKAFPATFRMKAFGQDTFKVSRANSFMSDGCHVIYTSVLRNGMWAEFAKGTPIEVAREVVFIEGVELPVEQPTPAQQLASVMTAKEEVNETCEKLVSLQTAYPENSAWVDEWLTALQDRRSELHVADRQGRKPRQVYPYGQPVDYCYHCATGHIIGQCFDFEGDCTWTNYLKRMEKKFS